MGRKSFTTSKQRRSPADKPVSSTTHESNGPKLAHSTMFAFSSSTEITQKFAVTRQLLEQMQKQRDEIERTSIASAEKAFLETKKEVEEIDRKFSLRCRCPPTPGPSIQETKPPTLLGTLYTKPYASLEEMKAFADSLEDHLPSEYHAAIEELRVLIRHCEWEARLSLARIREKVGMYKSMASEACMTLQDRVARCTCGADVVPKEEKVFSAPT